jgi:hypothetical protein
MDALAMYGVYVCGAYLFADLLTGIFHWWEDRYGNPAWPILGALVVAPNIQHHKSPSAFTKGNYFYRNWTTLVPTLALGALCYLSGEYFLALTCLFMSQSNELHCWSHMRCSYPIRLLQRTGLIQTPKMHAIHHKRPYDQNYCVMTSFLNPPLTAIHYWGALEYLVGLFGVHPREERKIY